MRDCEYRLGSRDVWPRKGRTRANPTHELGDARHVGLAFAEFAKHEDILVASTPDGLFEGAAQDDGTIVAPAATAQILETFGGALTAPTWFDSAERIQSAAYLERLYIQSGVAAGSVEASQNIVRGHVKQETAGATTFVPRYWFSGMVRPAQAPTIAVTQVAGNPTPFTYPAVGWLGPPTALAQWQNAANAIDGDEETAMTVVKYKGDGTGTVFSHDFSFEAAPSDTSSGRSLYITLRSQVSGGSVGQGGQVRYTTEAYLIVMTSTYNGSVWSEFQRVYIRRCPTVDIERFIMPMGVLDTQRLRVRIRLRIDEVTAREPVGAECYDIYIAKGNATTAPKNLSIRYGYTEYDSTTDRESDMSLESDSVTITAGTTIGTTVTVNRILNPQTTHVRLFCQTAGAARGEMDRYYLVGVFSVEGLTPPVSINDDIRRDLEVLGKIQPPLLIVGSGANKSYYPRNSPPPVSKAMFIYRGQACYIPISGEEMWYSLPFRAESCSPLYTMPIRSPRNDEPTAGAGNDDVGLVFMRSWTKRIHGLPTVVEGVFDPTQPTDASSTRGCGGPLALDWFTMPSGDGREWLAVLDYQGLYITNGYEFTPWSENIDIWTWADADQIEYAEVKNNALERRLELYLVASGGAPSDTSRIVFFVYYGDMQIATAREDRQPKWTGPHTYTVGPHAFGVPGAQQRHWSGSLNPASPFVGDIYLEESGLVDANKPTGAQLVVRSIQTGRWALAGEARDWFLLKTVALRTRLPDTAPDTISFDSTLWNDYAGSQETSNVYDPEFPESFLVNAAGQHVAFYLEDSSIDEGGATTERGAIAGIDLEIEPVAGSESMLNSSAGTTLGARGTGTLPTT